MIGMKKAISALMIIILLLLAAGCAKKTGDQGGASVPAKKETPAPSAGPTPVPTAEPTPDPVKAEAVRIAGEHGLSEDELYGEYGLFIGFSEAVESAPDMGGYKEFVYRIFPVIADNTEYIDTEHLFKRLASLRFEEFEIRPGIAGQYRYEPNVVIINPDRGESDDSQIPSIVFHELMHFVDFSVGGGARPLYLLDGERLTADEFLALPPEDQIKAVVLYEAEPVKEGGAELFTAKYFAGAVRSYFGVSRFLTGLECIYGEETLKELFFSGETDALFAELLFDAGYTEDEYYTAAASLNWLTDPTANYLPKDYIMPEDILIDLYEHKLGGGWKTDERFLYVLKAINGVAWSGYEASEHADFLEGIEFGTFREYEEFESSVYADLPFKPEVRYLPPAPVIHGGRFTLAAFAEWTDPDSSKLIHGTIIAEYDFETGRPVGYEITDMDGLLKEYFG